MRSNRSIMAACAMALALGACSETTWRTSSLREVELDKRRLTVSWVRTEPEIIDLVVWEEPRFSGTMMPDQPRLDRALAERAAQDVVGQNCTSLAAPATIGDLRHTFRYRCGTTP